MRKIIACLLLFAAATLSVASVAAAEEIKAIAVIKTIELAADGNSAKVRLEDNKTGDIIEVMVEDQLTLDKFKDHRIIFNDEIRLKYEPQDNGEKLSTYFRKTAGC